MIRFAAAEVVRFDPRLAISLPLEPHPLDGEQDGEAPPDAPMGRWAWPSRREGVTATEPENETERRLYKSLRAHFATSHVGLPNGDAAILRTCLDAGWYRRVLHAPPAKKLFRGLRLNSAKAVAKLLGVPAHVIQGDFGAWDFNRSIDVANGFSTSWSAKKSIAAGDFGMRGKRGWGVTLIMLTEQNQGRLLAGPGGLYDVNGLSRWHLEKETVGLEPITIQRIEWRRFNARGPLAPEQAAMVERTRRVTDWPPKRNDEEAI